MKILFLDFDGVICTEESYVEARKKYGITDTGFPPSVHLIVPELVARVQEICDATGASIVISSTWRELHEWDDLLGFLKTHGLTAEVIDKTPSEVSSRLSRYSGRADEISEWLKQHPDISLKNIVILDDDIGAFYNYDEIHDGLKSRIVVTEFSDVPKIFPDYPEVKAGLQSKHVKKAIELLNG